MPKAQGVPGAARSCCLHAPLKLAYSPRGSVAEGEDEGERHLDLCLLQQVLPRSCRDAGLQPLGRWGTTANTLLSTGHGGIVSQGQQPPPPPCFYPPLPIGQEQDRDRALPSGGAGGAAAVPSLEHPGGCQGSGAWARRALSALHGPPGGQQKQERGWTPGRAHGTEDQRKTEKPVQAGCDRTW